MQQHSDQRRSPLVAWGMSFVLPGFGQMYNGELNKAIWLFLCFALLSIPGLAVIALYLPAAWMITALALGLISALSIWLYGMVDAWRTASRLQVYVRASWQLSGVYVLAFLLCNALAMPLLINYVREHQVAAYRIPSRSMEPSVLQGDMLFADKRYNRPEASTAVRRGDIAIFTYPNNRTLNYIKRVIALPGDRVRMSGHAIWVNDQLLTVKEQATPDGALVSESVDGRQWQVQWLASDKTTPTLDLTVPPGQAFVLGDNRSGSTDTRHFGPVPLSDIVGNARQIWFSSDARDGVRWNRFGLVLQ